MSSIRRRGLVAAMKNVSLEELQETEQKINDTQPNIDPEVDEPAPEQEKTEEIVFPEASESPEAQEVEVEKVEAEVVSIEEAIDEAIDIIDQVENIADIVDRGNENGGLNQTGAELLTATLESLYERAGVQKKQGELYVPSIESFGGTGSRIRAGNIALEDMKTRVKEIWTNIVKAIKAFIEKGKQFLKEMFVQSERLKVRNVKLREIASKVPNKARNSSIQNARIAEGLAVGTSVPTNIIQEIENVAAIGEKIVSNISVMTTEAGKKYLGLMKLAANLDAKIFMDKVSEYSEVYGDFQSSSNIYTEVGGSTDFQMTSPTIPGNKRFALTLPDPTDLSTIKVGVIDVEAEVSPALKVLSKSELVALFKATDSILATVEKMKDSAKTKEQVKDQMVQAASSLQAAEDKVGEDADVKEMFSVIRKSIQKSVDSVDAVDKQFIRQALRIVRVSQNYIQECLKEYVPEKVAKAEEAPATA